MTEFQGFPSPERNYSHLPHAFIDLLPTIKSVSEVKVVLYILRHTWGFQEFDRPKRLTVDEFMNGRKRADGSRMDAGTGLTKPSVISGLRDAEEHGFIVVEVDDSDAARVEKSYAIKMAGSNSFTPEVKKFYPGGKEVLPRTEKETSERNSDDANDSCAREEERPTIYAVYEQNIGTIGPHVRDCLIAAQSDYPAGWLEEAIKEAAEYNGRSWSYVESILKNWQAQGYKGKRKPAQPAPVVAHAPAPATPATPSAPQINPFRSNPS